MKNKDQFLLEAAYDEISNKVKELYKEIRPLVDKILGGEKMAVWDLDEEDQAGEFKAYSQFGLKKSEVPGSEHPAIRFGNWYRGQLWGFEISPWATTPKKYAALLHVLKKKAQS